MWVSAIAIILYIILGIAIIVAWTDIFLKAGYSRWYCLLIVIPVVNLIVFFWFAFSRWPILDFVKPDWRLQKLQEKKRELERAISVLDKSESNSANAQPPEKLKQETEQDIATRSVSPQENIKEVAPIGKVGWIVLGLAVAIISGLVFAIAKGC